MPAPRPHRRRHRPVSCHARRRRRRDAHELHRPGTRRPATERAVRRRSVRIRLARDGLARSLFLLPLLVVFGLFAWFPILRALVMSVQETNLVSDPTFVGLDNFARVLADPQFGIAVAQHGLVRAAGPALRVPGPDHPRASS